MRLYISIVSVPRLKRPAKSIASNDAPRRVASRLISSTWHQSVDMTCAVDQAALPRPCPSVSPNPLLWLLQTLPGRALESVNESTLLQSQNKSRHRHKPLKSPLRLRARQSNKIPRTSLTSSCMKLLPPRRNTVQVFGLATGTSSSGVEMLRFAYTALC